MDGSADRRRVRCRGSGSLATANALNTAISAANAIISNSSSTLEKRRLKATTTSTNSSTSTKENPTSVTTTRATSTSGSNTLNQDYGTESNNENSYFLSSNQHILRKQPPRQNSGSSSGRSQSTDTAGASATADTTPKTTTNRRNNNLQSRRKHQGTTLGDIKKDGDLQQQLQQQSTVQQRGVDASSVSTPDAEQQVPPDVETTPRIHNVSSSTAANSTTNTNDKQILHLVTDHAKIRSVAGEGGDVDDDKFIVVTGMSASEPSFPFTSNETAPSDVSSKKSKSIDSQKRRLEHNLSRGLSNLPSCNTTPRDAASVASGSSKRSRMSSSRQGKSTRLKSSSSQRNSAEQLSSSSKQRDNSERFSSSSKGDGDGDADAAVDHSRRARSRTRREQQVQQQKTHREATAATRKTPQRSGSQGSQKSNASSESKRRSRSINQKRGESAQRHHRSRSSKSRQTGKVGNGEGEANGIPHHQRRPRSSSRKPTSDSSTSNRRSPSSSSRASTGTNAHSGGFTGAQMEDGSGNSSGRKTPVRNHSSGSHGQNSRGTVLASPALLKALTPTRTTATTTRQHPRRGSGSSQDTHATATIPLSQSAPSQLLPCQQRPSKSPHRRETVQHRKGDCNVYDNEIDLTSTATPPGEETGERRHPKRSFSANSRTRLVRSTSAGGGAYMNVNNNNKKMKDHSSKRGDMDHHSSRRRNNNNTNDMDHSRRRINSSSSDMDHSRQRINSSKNLDGSEMRRTLSSGRRSSNRHLLVTSSHNNDRLSNKHLLAKHSSTMGASGSSSYHHHHRPSSNRHLMKDSSSAGVNRTRRSISNRRGGGGGDPMKDNSYNTRGGPDNTYMSSSSRRSKSNNTGSAEGDSADVSQDIGENRWSSSRPKQEVNLDQSLNNLLSAYNNTTTVSSYKLSDSFSATGSELGDSSSVLSLDDCSAKTDAQQRLEDPEDSDYKNTSRNAGGKLEPKKKKKSLASRVKRSLRGKSEKDKAFPVPAPTDEEEITKRLRQTLAERRAAIAAMEAHEGERGKQEQPPRQPSEEDATEDTDITDPSMDESSSDKKGVLRRVGRRLYLTSKDKSSASEQNPSFLDNGVVGNDNNDGKNIREQDLFQEHGSNKKQMLDRSDQEQRDAETAKKNLSGKNSVGKNAHNSMNKSNKNQKKGKVSSLARRITGRSSKKIPLAQMEKLHDSFSTIDTVDRAILATTATMEDALQELDNADQYTMGMEQMDKELGLHLDPDGSDSNFQLMGSFAQLDFAGIASRHTLDLDLPDDDTGSDEKVDTAISSLNVISQKAASAGQEKPKVVVRRNKSNQNKREDDDANRGIQRIKSSDDSRTVRGKRKKQLPTKLPPRTLSEPQKGGTPDVFDWEKHSTSVANRRERGIHHRRSSSVNALRASTTRARQRAEKSSRREDSDVAAKDSKREDSENGNSDASLDVSVLSEARPEEGNMNKAGNSLPSLLSSKTMSVRNHKSTASLLANKV